MNSPSLTNIWFSQPSSYLAHREHQLYPKLSIGKKHKMSTPYLYPNLAWLHQNYLILYYGIKTWKFNSNNCINLWEPKFKAVASCMEFHGFLSSSWRHLNQVHRRYSCQLLCTYFLKSFLASSKKQQVFTYHAAKEWGISCTACHNSTLGWIWSDCLHQESVVITAWS